MNKPSEFFDFLDTGAEFYNSFIDMNNELIAKEINWLSDNYENIYVLREYFLRFANNQHFSVYLSYLKYLNSLTDDEIKLAAKNRANVLYSHLKYNENSKVDNKPLKVIAEELKKYNQ